MKISVDENIPLITVRVLREMFMPCETFAAQQRRVLTMMLYRRCSTKRAIVDHDRQGVYAAS